MPFIRVSAFSRVSNCNVLPPNRKSKAGVAQAIALIAIVNAYAYKLTGNRDHMTLYLYSRG